MKPSLSSPGALQRLYKLLSLAALLASLTSCGALRAHGNSRGRNTVLCIRTSAAPSIVRKATQTRKANQQPFTLNYDSNNSDNDSINSLEEGGFSSLTVTEIKEKLREMGLPVSGVKTALIERLVAASGGVHSSSSDIAFEEEEEDVSLTIGPDAALSADQARWLIALGTDTLKKSGHLYPAASAAMNDDFSGGAAVRSYSPRDRTTTGAVDRASSAVPSRSQGSGDTQTAQIEKLVFERYEARLNRDFPQADAIRDELESRFDVKIFDKDGIWVSGDNSMRGPLNPTMRARQGSGGCSLSNEAIQELIVKRTMARRERDFGMADRLRDQLTSSGVELLDKVNMWRSADGREGSQSPEDVY